MKNLPKNLAYIFLGLSLVANVNFASAALLIPPDGGEVITKEPNPVPPPQPPEQTQQTQTQQDGSTPGVPLNNSGIPSNNNSNTGGQILTINPNLEKPELISIDAISSSQTQTCTINSPICPGTAETVQSINSNQAKTFTILISGSLIGFIFWLLTAKQSANSGQIRDNLKFDRQLKSLATNHRNKELIGSYSKIMNSLGNIISSIDQKTDLNQNDLKHLKTAALDLELFASEETRAASKKLQNILSHEKAPSLTELNSARNHLAQSIKKDLGI